MKRIATLIAVFVVAGSAFCAQVIFEGGTANVGARFFLETRFSRFFYANSGGNANFVLTNGDPVMNTSETISAPLPGPFAGRAMNCRACHLVEEHANVSNRTYNDFARRSPIPDNGDGRTHTPRNSMDLVNSLLEHPTPLFLHHDGQFASAHDLIVDTFTGRNFGWRPTEYSNALAHIARIVREDDGTGGLAQQYGGFSYAEALAGGPQIPDQYRIMKLFTLQNVGITNTSDPNYVSDGEIIEKVAGLVEAYMSTLVFSFDLDGIFDGSPFDVFLIKNGLPRVPAPSETPLQYSRRLLHMISNLPNPRFVSDPADGHMITHSQAFQFGPAELAGLKIYFAEPGPGAVPGRIGNCITCHAPPAFTDFLFHNTGAAQEEYDAVHGSGAFMTLNVPELSVRQANHNAYLPPTPAHPNALGTFINPPSLDHPGEIDLGLWNVFANPDFPNPQPALQQIVPLLFPVPVPQIARSSKIGNSFIFSGSNGVPGWSYYVLTATNPTLASASWDTISTNTFDTAGNFSVTNSAASDAQRFYRLAATTPNTVQILPRTIALFKTPDLRDLASSDPYFHTGRFNTLQDVIGFYQTASTRARAGGIRNASPELSKISLDSSSVAPLIAFLRSLNQDYQDIPCPCD